MKVTVQQRQTLSDLAIQVYGDVRAAGIIAVTNQISVTDDLEPGMVLECPGAVFDKYLQMFVVKRGLQPATAADPGGKMAKSVFTEQFTEEFK